MRKSLRIIFLCSGLIGLLGLFSGCQSGSNDAKIDQQIAHGTWRVLSDIPVGRFGGAAAVVRDKLHVFGGVNMNPHTPAGMDRARAVNLHHIYDPATD